MTSRLHRSGLAQALHAWHFAAPHPRSDHPLQLEAELMCFCTADGYPKNYMAIFCYVNRENEVCQR
jgi:hypothetical protein